MLQLSASLKRTRRASLIVLFLLAFRVLYDVRLHNTSQLSGFAKADDLAFFLDKIGNIKYQHQPLLAPTDTMLKAFKRDKGDWSQYQQKFLNLMAERKIEDQFTPSIFDDACLLCSEATPHHCHRRLVSNI